MPKYLMMRKLKLYLFLLFLHVVHLTKQTKFLTSLVCNSYEENELACVSPQKTKGLNIYLRNRLLSARFFGSFLLKQLGQSFGPTDVMEVKPP